MAIENIAKSLGVTPLVVILIFIGIIAVTYHIYTRTDRRKGLITVAGAITIIAASFILTAEEKVEPELIDGRNAWQVLYEKQASANIIEYNEYTENTAYYDYDSQVISDNAERIARESASSREAIENTLKFVFKNVQYVLESDGACFSGTAPTILQSGKGQCDTQSIVVTSLLRKMGIAARPVGGCISLNKDCRLQALFLNSGIAISGAPQYVELEEVDLDPAAPTFSRAGPFSRAGGLHAWVAAWTPEEGWLTLETTNGLIANENCYSYHVELIPSNNQKNDICVTKNFDYASACRKNDFEAMNANGLGLMEDVFNGQR